MTRLRACSMLCVVLDVARVGHRRRLVAFCVTIRTPTSCRTSATRARRLSIAADRRRVHSGGAHADPIPTVLVIRSSRVVLPTGERPASLVIEDGTITGIAAYDEVPAGAELVEAGSLVVSPGVVDSHVHINDPGRSDWEGF